MIGADTAVAPIPGQRPKAIRARGRPHSLTDAEKIQAAALREEKGWGLDRISAHFDRRISAKSLGDLFLREGVELPPRQRRPLPRYQRQELTRNGRPLVRFGPEDDAVILRMRAEGANNAAIGRALTPPRLPHTILGRLLTLARHQMRAEEAADH